MIITSKNFAKKCDVVICCHFEQEIKNSHSPSRIFVTGEQLLFERALDYLKSFKNKYDLVYHCSDSPFDIYKFESIREYVNHIYAENCEIKHDMITQLPLGFYQNSEIPKQLNIQFNDRKILCYLNVGLYNNELQFVKCKSIREECLKCFKQKSFVTIESNVPREEFYNTVNDTKFVICPMGYGIDTFRFYEASYLGCVPIVKNSGLNSLYEKYNPIIVDRWDEITEELLLNHEYKKPDEKFFDVDYFFSNTN